jgi:imidazolonepropionase-like amidohydrolase
MRFVAAVCLTFLHAIASVSASGGAGKQLALKHVHVVDTGTLSVRDDQTVVINGARISVIGPSKQTKLPAGCQVVEARGKYLMAGLWDMHVHIAGVSADPAWSKRALLPLLLANGIVGVRDMGGDLEALLAWKREIENGTLLGPHIVAGGPWLSGGGKKSAEQYPVMDADEARTAVRDLKLRGADFIKVISLPNRDAFFAVADESKKQKIEFVGHLPIEVSALEASNVGMRSIEHFFYSAFSLSVSAKEVELRERLMTAQQKGDSAAWEQISREADETYSAEKAAAVYDSLKKNGTWVTPTLASMDTASHAEKWKADDAQLEFVPIELAKQWRASINDERAKKRAEWLGRQISSDWKLAAELHRAGVAELVGSDSLDMFVFPGESLHRELAELVRAGFTPGEALRAATLGAAQFLHREDDFGAVTVGKLADLVMMDANPLEDISNTRKIRAVVRAGNYLDRGALDRLSADAKAAAGAGAVHPH